MRRLVDVLIIGSLICILLFGFTFKIRIGPPNIKDCVEFHTKCTDSTTVKLFHKTHPTLVKDRDVYIGYLFKYSSKDLEGYNELLNTIK